MITDLVSNIRSHWSYIYAQQCFEQPAYEKREGGDAEADAGHFEEALLEVEVLGDGEVVVEGKDYGDGDREGDGQAGEFVRHEKEGEYEQDDGDEVGAAGVEG